MLNSPALEYFLEVVRTGSVNEASRRLLVAGSAISRQIGKLEQEIGVPLFERRPRGMVPSEAGALLAAYARRATLETDQVLAEIRGRGRLGATVRVASSQGASQEFLPHAMATFRKENPGTTFQLPVVSPSSATQMVKDGSVDLAVTFSLAPAPDVRVIHAQRAPIQAVVRSDHPLAQRTKSICTICFPIRSPSPKKAPRTGASSTSAARSRASASNPCWSVPAPAPCPPSSKRRMPFH